MKRNIKIMYLLALLQGMVFYAPVATLYRQARGLTITQITLIEGISLALTLLFEFPWGVAADKIGYKKSMLICNGLYLVSKVVFWKAGGFLWFLGERVLLAIVCAGLSGVDTSILYLSCKEEESQKVFSVYDNCGRVGLLMAAGLYSLFMAKSYEMSAVATVISYGMAFLLTFGLTEVKATKQEEDNNILAKNEAGNDVDEVKKAGNSIKEMLSMWKGLMKRKSLLLLILAVALLTETEHTITTFLNQLQYTRCGMTEGQISVVYIAMTLLGLLGVFSERGSKKLGHRRFGKALIGSCFTACVCLVLTKSAVLSVVAVLLLHIAFSMFTPLQMELQNQAVCTDNRATELSMNAVLIDALGVFITMILGAVAEISVSMAMAAGALLCGIAFLLFHFGKIAFSDSTAGNIA